MLRNRKTEQGYTHNLTHFEEVIPDAAAGANGYH
jgi:hypothetical protein